LPQAPAEVHLWPFAVAWLIALAGGALAYAFYSGGLIYVPGQLARSLSGAYSLLQGKFWIDELYDRALVRPLRGTANMLWRAVDSIIIDAILVRGSAHLVRASAQIFRLFQNGNVQRYLAVLILAATAILWMVTRQS